MSDNQSQEVKDRLNIADVIGGYLPLKKAGVNFKTTCPFHNEKTPSFNVNVPKQIWHCFGCGEGGDVFTFVMRYENLDFKSALKLLAEKAGVNLPTYQPKNLVEEQEKAQLFRINLFTAKLYHQVLLKDPKAELAKKYLVERGLTLETIKHWQVGFALNEFNFLRSALGAKQVSDTLMVKAGVVVNGENQKFYDRFRGRITFPIFDALGQVVGFSARILPSLDNGKTAKYINSPETLIYQKGKMLFGLNFAKSAIRQQNEAIVVEGQMDCVASHQAGVENVVASSGTALTLEQLMQIKKLTTNLKFCFDADSAGQLALRRAVEVALPLGFSLSVIQIGTVKDPDELIKQDKQAWPMAIASAVPYFDYFIQTALTNFSGGVEQKKTIAHNLVPLLAKISDPVEQDHYLVKLANLLSIHEKALRQLLMAKPNRANVSAVVLTKTNIQPVNEQGLLAEEKLVLGGILAVPEFLKQIHKSLDLADFTVLAIKDAVSDVLNHTNQEALLAGSLAKEAIFVVESLVEQQGQKPTLRQLLKSYSLLKIKQLKKKQKQLQFELGILEQSGKKDEILSMRSEFAKVSKEIVFWER
jgi:DNA primase